MTPIAGSIRQPGLATVLAKRKERRRFYHSSFLSVDTSETGEGLAPASGVCRTL